MRGIKGRGNALFRLSLALTGLYGVTAFAVDTIPDCPAYRLKKENGGNPGSLPVNNQEVLRWKASTPNQYVARAHVLGAVVTVYPDRNGHEHFSIRIGPREEDTVEIIYNSEFGPLPDSRPGMPVEACGDYITSHDPAPAPGGGSYPPSPDGALVHWVHMAFPSSGHHSGYVMINGLLAGQGSPARPRPPRGAITWMQERASSPSPAQIGKMRTKRTPCRVTQN